MLINFFSLFFFFLFDKVTYNTLWLANHKYYLWPCAIFLNTFYTVLFYQNVFCYVTKKMKLYFFCCLNCTDCASYPSAIRSSSGSAVTFIVSYMWMAIFLNRSQKAKTCIFCLWFGGIFFPGKLAPTKFGGLKATVKLWVLSLCH